MKGAILTLMGKVSRKVVNSLSKSKTNDKDNTWFFVDYSNDEIRIGEAFDTLLEGDQKTLIPGIVKVKLKKVYDQLGHDLDYIPDGFQTICKFDFGDNIPTPINRLPTFNTWEYNSNSISIAKHQSIQLSEPPDFMTKTMNSLFITHIKNYIRSHKSTSHKSTITYNELREVFLEKFSVKDPKEIATVLNRWKILGLLKEHGNEELELVAEDL